MAPGFDTPLRRRLTDQLRFFVHELNGLGVHGEIWINGSYATRKPDPRDVDVALSMSPLALQAISPQHQQRLGYYADQGRDYVRRRWSVDFYIFDATKPSRREYYRELFSNNPDQSSPKGIPFVRI